MQHAVPPHYVPIYHVDASDAVYIIKMHILSFYIQRYDYIEDARIGSVVLVVVVVVIVLLA